MMPSTFDVIDGATPLDPDTLAGLKLGYITTQADLNTAEEANILAALDWTRRARSPDLFHLDYTLELHRRMFGDVWSWAGMWRNRETNIGVAPNTITMRTQGLLNDVRYWADNAVYRQDEVAVRLHHQMVAIHPFVNGNGRHTRLLADLLVSRLGQAAFSWGGRSLSTPSAIRRAYIACLKQADSGDIEPLLAFARS